jgi:hypothetical protein
MATMPDTSTNAVELFPALHPSSRITDELTRILAMLRDLAPRDAVISFDFDGKLHVHIDVRKREEVTVIEAVLPTLDGGRFGQLSRGATPHHPFFHRVSAVVAS